MSGCGGRASPLIQCLAHPGYASGAHASGGRLLAGDRWAGGGGLTRQLVPAEAEPTEMTKKETRSCDVCHVVQWTSWKQLDGAAVVAKMCRRAVQLSECMQPADGAVVHV